MNSAENNSQKGQVVVLVAIMLLAMLAMLALVLDGGNAYLQRRQAQNAADAAALAGGRTYCLTQSQSQALSVAQTYGVTNNGASSLDVSFPSTNTINVVAHINFNTFFAQLIGRDQMTASAEAASGCFAGESAHILPIAWACHRPTITSTTSYDCIGDVISIDEAKDHAFNPRTPPSIYPELYVIMDSGSTPFDASSICQTTTISGTVTGTLNCDVDGDGNSDLIANGDRGWLNLSDGGPSASQLGEWIRGINPVSVRSHTWMGGAPGNMGPLYGAVADFVGSIFTVPVFDDICDVLPANNGNCDNTRNYFTGVTEDRVHDADIINNARGSNYYYHIIGFAHFYVTCVQENQQWSTRITPAGPLHEQAECPGWAAGKNIGTVTNSTKTIEGYFVSGIIPDMVVDPDNPGLNMGTYGIVLLK